MVSIAVLKMGMTELIFVVLLSVDAASDQACYKRYVCLSTRQRFTSSYKDNIKQLQQETPDLIGLDLWPPNSPNQNLVDYKV